MYSANTAKTNRFIRIVQETTIKIEKSPPRGAVTAAVVTLYDSLRSVPRDQQNIAQSLDRRAQLIVLQTFSRFFFFFFVFHITKKQTRFSRRRRHCTSTMCTVSKVQVCTPEISFPDDDSFFSTKNFRFPLPPVMQNGVCKIHI